MRSSSTDAAELFWTAVAVIFIVAAVAIIGC